MAVRVINISKDLEPILGFLYPTYSFTDGLTRFRHFITHYDVESAHEREILEHNYEDGVIISTRIFDTLYTPEVMAADTLAFAREHFGCRKRTFTIQSTDPQAMIAECLRFIYYGPDNDATDESGIDTLLKSYGSKLFFSSFLHYCERKGRFRAISSIETYIAKVLSDSNTIYYKRARQRLLRPLERNIVGALSEIRNVDPYFAKHHKDLVSLRLFTQLLKG